MGGGQTVLLQMVGAALERGAQVKVMAPGGGELESAARGLGIEWESLPPLEMGSGKKSLRDFWRFSLYARVTLRLLRPQLERFDRVIVNGPRMLPLVALATGLVRARAASKVSYHIHVDHSIWIKKMVRFVVGFRSTRNVIFHSEYLYRAYRESCGDLAKAAVIENALSPKWSALEFTSTREKADGILRVACVGRISPEKGQDLLLEALAGIEGVELYLIGDPDFADRAYADRLKRSAPRGVEFTGKSKDVLKTLRELGIQVCVVPSRWEEPFGLVLIEAQAASCIGVTSATGGMADIARRTGSLVAHGVTELREIIEKLKLMAAEDFKALARSQWEKTQAAYPPRSFSDRWWERLGLS
jgi:glycosyltransferase involved in cell wall biosynthesis